MNEIAKGYVAQYIKEHYGIIDETLFVVWESTVLQNYKCLIATTLPIHTRFELTHDGDSNCWYIDVFKKVDNAVIPDD